MGVIYIYICLRPLHCATLYVPPCSDSGGWSDVLFSLVTDVPQWRHIPDVFLDGCGTRSWPSSGVRWSREKTLLGPWSIWPQVTIVSQWPCVKEHSSLTQVTKAGRLATEAKGQDLCLEGSPQTVCT